MYTYIYALPFVDKRIPEDFIIIIMITIIRRFSLAVCIKRESKWRLEKTREFLVFISTYFTFCTRFIICCSADFYKPLILIIVVFQMQRKKAESEMKR